MKPLYTPEQFKTATSRTPLYMECYFCKNSFPVFKNEIQKTIKRMSIKTNLYPTPFKYCSKECRINAKHTGHQVNCVQCNTTTYKQLKDIKKNKNLFCSSSCSAIWNNNHKTWGGKRSKLEKWLEQQLLILYPSLEIIYNTTKEVECELDIYIPSLKLAFELNGIFHYEPIYGIEWFSKVKVNDERKFQNCITKNISLCIIDTTLQKRFTENSSIKFLEIIKNTIEHHKQILG